MADEFDVEGATGFTPRELAEAAALAARSNTRSGRGLSRVLYKKTAEQKDWLMKEMMAVAALNPPAPYLKRNRFDPKFWGM